MGKVGHDQEIPTEVEVERLEQVVKWLQRRQAHVAAHVIHLGEVRFTDAVDTAGVRVTGSQIELFFNREFFHSLKIVELVAVLLHESLHVVFRHQARAEAIQNNWKRRLFTLACEAVINDTIMRYFKEIELPDGAITGPSLVGCDTSRMTSEQVMTLIRDQGREQELVAFPCMDDHDLWDPQKPGESHGLACRDVGRPRWDEESDKLAERIKLMSHGHRIWGSEALGSSRLVPRKRGRTDLRRFLVEQLRPALRYATIWSVPNRKSMAIYPNIILPSYDPESWNVRVLMAIDSSGSVSDDFLGVAQSVANQNLPGTRLRIISFDTRVYEVQPGAKTLRGGGGTDPGAVEQYILREMPAYPDYVFIFTDGFMPKPNLRHPERWIWLLTPNGTDWHVPKLGKIYRFDPRET